MPNRAALGHEIGSSVTSIYIDFDQRKVDAANRAVIDYLNTHNDPVNEDIKTELANMLE